MRCEVFRNQTGSSPGGITFSPNPDDELLPGVRYGSISIADVDDDCDPDIVVLGETNDGTFTATLHAQLGGTPGPYYADLDGDGYGDANVPLFGCPQPEGTVLDGTDCDDQDPNVYFGASCDDGNPFTENDAYDENCDCLGEMMIDCLGVPNGPALPGTPCNDGLCSTMNDEYDANCDCTGDCRETKLSSDVGPTFSCGASKMFNSGQTYNRKIYATNPEPWWFPSCNTTYSNVPISI
jgi:hypothetical protein